MTSVWEDREALSRAAAAELADAAAKAIEARGRFDLALAGGSTPRRLYEILASEYYRRIGWARTHLFWSDERYVPESDPLSNSRMARKALLDPLGITPENVHAMPTFFPDPEQAALAYEQTLRTHFGGGIPRFDLILLGMGPEGHTASLFPGSAALEEKMRWVLPVRVAAEPPLRLTLTLPVLNAAREVFFLVSGPDKAAIVRKILSLSPDEVAPYPAARVNPEGRVILFLDRAAQG
ncbi:MAG: 6-phosphogluconolactonase [Acidobacteriota bacterium]|nr:6-phosphogluconolactonase [Acidobacteriota bacterium]